MFKKSVYVFGLLLLAAALVSCKTPPPPAPVAAVPPPVKPAAVAPAIVIPPPPVIPVYKPPATSFADAVELVGADSSAERIVMARRSALTSSPIKQRLTREQINECMDILSDTCMMEYDLFLRPFSPFETKLIARMQQTEPPIVARTGLELLRGILKNNALLSPREAVSRGIPVSVATPSSIQEKLFGSCDSVIATVGSPDGSPRYGDVIIRLKPSVKNLGWATPWSGMQFKADIRQLAKKQDPADVYIKDRKGQEVKVDFDDLNHLSQYVVIGRDWNRALAYQAVLTLRKVREPNSFASNTSAETIDAGLLNASPQVFWKTLSQDRGACFLEAKFPGSVPADYFESIEVSKQDLPIVMAWPEAAPYKSIIHEIPAKSAAVK